MEIFRAHFGGTNRIHSSPANCVATLRISTDVNTKTIILTPFKDATATMAASDVGKQVFKWTCGGTIPINIRPGSCRA